MRVCVAGLWHLGVVTAACVAAAGHRVVAYDEDASVVDGLRRGVLPVDEPGLAELVHKGLQDGSLELTDQRERALQGAEVVWIAYDTPVDADDRADVDFVVTRARALVADCRRIRVARPDLVAVPVGRPGLRPGARSRTRPRICGSAPRSPRSRSRSGSSSGPADGDRSRIEELLGAFSDGSSGWASSRRSS